MKKIILSKLILIAFLPLTLPAKEDKDLMSAFREAIEKKLEAVKGDTYRPTSSTSKPEVIKAPPIPVPPEITISSSQAAKMVATPKMAPAVQIAAPKITDGPQPVKQDGKASVMPLKDISKSLHSNFQGPGKNNAPAAGSTSTVTTFTRESETTSESPAQGHKVAVKADRKIERKASAKIRTEHPTEGATSADKK